MWGLALQYGFKFPGSRILEPAVGSGRFLQFIEPGVTQVVAYDVDEVAVSICRVLFPAYDIRSGSFEQMFFRGNRHVGTAGIDDLFDLVITNPPYREYASEYAPLGEREATGADTFEAYFIMRGVDVLKRGGLLVMIIPNTFLANKHKYNDLKNKLNEKAELLAAYRLPNGVFGNTEVGTDIIVLKKR
jgi:tRNA G10  N-methylase Trm11